jgi:hypothetical protein
MRKAIKAGRYKVENVELAWRMTIWCLVGVGVDLCKQRRSIAEADAVIDAAVVNILRTLGMDTAEAKVVARGIHLRLTRGISPPTAVPASPPSPGRAGNTHAPH